MTTTATKTEAGLTANQLIAELSRSAHGDYNAYGPVATKAATEQSDLLAHLIAYNLTNGSIRDSKVAFPAISLMLPGFPEALRENSMAALASLSPRDFLAGVKFARTLTGLRGWTAAARNYQTRTKVGNKFRTTTETKPSFDPVRNIAAYVIDSTASGQSSFKLSEPGLFNMRAIKALITRYLRFLESDRQRWDRTAIQHSDSLRQLYKLGRVPQSDWVATVLWGSVKVNGVREKRALPANSIFADLKRLGKVTPAEAARIILQRNIPAMIAVGALGPHKNSPDVMLALIENSTPAQLVNNARLLKRMGMDNIPALRAAYAAGIAKDTKNPTALLKATEAADALAEEDGETNELVVKLRAHQERKLKEAGGIDGNWAVFVDKSPSMANAIEVGRRVAGTLAKLVRGTVRMILFDGTAYEINVTGMDYDAVLAKTKTVTAGGSGTSIGAGLQLLLDSDPDIDGIAIVSDAQENTRPMFADQYKLLNTKLGKEVPVYLYRMQPTTRGYSDTDLGSSMSAAGFQLQEFDLQHGTTDYYALPGLVATMNVKRHGLLQKIMETDLLTLDQVLPLRAAGRTA